MSLASRVARGALGWGLWCGVAAALVWWALARVSRSAAAEPAVLATSLGVAFGAGFAVGAALFLYLRSLEKKAESRGS